MAYISQIKLSDTIYDISAIKLKNVRTIFGQSFDGTANVAGKPLVYGSYQSTAENRFANSGIEVRENGLVGSAQSDIGYAPSIGFHWQGRIAASLLFHNDGNFYLRKQDGTSRASLDANLIGNASTASKLATARTISLTGSVTGSGTFDGSGNLSIATTTNHSHSYLPLAGGTMTGSITLGSGAVQLKKAGTSASWINGRDQAAVRITSYNAYNAGLSMKTTNGSWEIGVYSNDNMWFTYAPDANYSAGTNTVAQFRAASNGTIYGAVWNDYAEFRNQKEEIKPGYCVASTNNGQLYKTTEKFQACDGIVSDTFGFAIGETDECKTPLAVAGRVLAYCEGDRYSYHSGDTVCAGPGGRVVKMTREEIHEWPDRIVGIVSEIPEYETWGTGNIQVNGRIWIKIK